MRPWIQFTVLLIVAFCVTGLSHDLPLMLHRGTTIHFLNVGQGDAILIVGPSGQQILIDGGPDLTTLEELGKFMPSFDRSIDLLILSHPNLDHLAAFPEILRRYTVKGVVLTGVSFRLARYTEMLTLMAEKRIPAIVADPAQDIDFGDGLTLDIVWPKPIWWNKTYDGDVNDTSVVVRVNYQDQCAILTGDMEEKEEREILASGQNIRCDILKIAHHGSRTSTGTGWLLAVQPKRAMISVGAKNSYGHPHPWILNRLRHFEIPYETTMSGAITMRLGKP